MSSSGRLLASPSLPSSASTADVSSLISEGSLVLHAGSSDAGGGWGGPPVSLEGAPVGPPLIPQHPTAETTTTSLILNQEGGGLSTSKSKGDDPEEEGGCLLFSPVAEDPWLHMPKAKPICIKEFSLSGRLPARQVCLSVSLSLSLSISLSICLSLYLSLFLSVSLSICLSLSFLIRRICT